MATTPTPPTPPAPPKEDKGFLTALAVGVLTIFVGFPNIKPLITLVRREISNIMSGLEYTLTHWGMHKLSHVTFYATIFSVLVRFIAWMVGMPEAYLSATTRVFAGTEILALILALYAKLIVRSATTEERDAMWEPWDKARAAVVETRRLHTEAVQGHAAGTMTLTQLQLAQQNEANAIQDEVRERQAFQTWDRDNGDPPMGFLGTTFMIWLMFVIQGFGYFIGGERAWHMATTLPLKVWSFLEMAYGLTYAGLIWFLPIHLLAKWVATPIFKVGSIGERIVTRAAHAYSAALQDGVTMKDVEKQIEELRAKYGDSYRTVTEILLNEVASFLYGVGVGSGLQVLVAFRTMSILASFEVTAVASFLVALVNMIHGYATDHVPRTHEKSKAWRLFFKVPMLPHAWAMIFGAGAYGVRLPHEVKADFVRFFSGVSDSSAARTVTHDVGRATSHTTSWWSDVVMQMDLGGIICVVVTMGIMIAMVYPFFPKVSKYLKDTSQPILNKMALGLVATFFVFFAILAIVVAFRTPRRYQEAERRVIAAAVEARRNQTPTRPQPRVISADCALNSEGYTRCSPTCFRQHGFPLGSPCHNDPPR